MNLCLVDIETDHDKIFESSINMNTELHYYNVEDKYFSINKNTINSSYDRLCFIFKKQKPCIDKFLNNKPLFTKSDLVLYEKSNLCSQNFNLVLKLIKKFKIKTVDFLACELLLYSEWKTYFSILEKLTGVVVGASSNKTGNIVYGGDWILESNMENIKNIYFNSNILNYTDLLDTTVATSTDNYLITNVNLGGTFTYSGVAYTTCNISTNGFIYFESNDVGPYNDTYKPLDVRAWNTLVPFGGNLRTTSSGITYNTSGSMFTVIFNCYSTPSMENQLTFGLTLYLSTHMYANRVDYFYTYSMSRSMYFSGDYYIGYGNNANGFKYVYDSDNLSSFCNGNASISSTNKFPSNLTISNVLNVPIVGTLKNADDGTAVEIPLGGNIMYGDNTYSTVSVNSNGSISFGEYLISNVVNPFEYSSYRLLSPFAGNMRTTSDGITYLTESNVCTITFNCYSSKTSNNILQFAIKLYLSTHSTRQNEVDYIYISSNSRNTGFTGEYYISFSNSITAGCCISTDEDFIGKFLYGYGYITSSNIFPETGTVITNVENKNLSESPVQMINVDDSFFLMPIGGTFVFGGEIYTNCYLMSNGYICFGSNLETDNFSPLTTEDLRSDTKFICPFGNDMKTTSNGIVLNSYPSDKLCKITFYMYVYYSSPVTITYEITLYFDDHPTRPNQVDIYYGPASSRNEEDLPYSINIGYCDGNIIRSVSSLSPFTVSSSGVTINSRNIFDVGTVLVINQESNTIKWKVDAVWITDSILYGDTFTSSVLNILDDAIISGTELTIPIETEYRLNNENGYLITEGIKFANGNYVICANFDLGENSNKYVIFKRTRMFTVSDIEDLGLKIALMKIHKNFSYTSANVFYDDDYRVEKICISWINEKNKNVIVMTFNTVTESVG